MSNLEQLKQEIAKAIYIKMVCETNGKSVNKNAKEMAELSVKAAETFVQVCKGQGQKPLPASSFIGPNNI